MSVARVSKEAGGCMFGNDASMWPAWYADACAVIHWAESMEAKTQQELLNASK